MPLTVRNNERNTTVFTKTINGDPVKIVWEALGQPKDSQRVPDAFAEDIDFLNALEQGVLTVTNGPAEVLARIDVETASAQAMRAEQQSRAAAASENFMERSQDKDLISASCIGPGPRPGQKCQRPLLIPSKDIKDVPPLCEEHGTLAPTFYLNESGSRGEGATETREGVVTRDWQQVVINPAVRAEG